MILLGLQAPRLQPGSRGPDVSAFVDKVHRSGAAIRLASPTKSEDRGLWSWRCGRGYIRLYGVPFFAFDRYSENRWKAALAFISEFLEVPKIILRRRRGNDGDDPDPLTSHPSNPAAPCSIPMVVIHLMKALRPRLPR